METHPLRKTEIRGRFHSVYHTGQAAIITDFQSSVQHVLRPLAWKSRVLSPCRWEGGSSAPLAQPLVESCLVLLGVGCLLLNTWAVPGADKQGCEVQQQHSQNSSLPLCETPSSELLKSWGNN